MTLTGNHVILIYTSPLNYFYGNTYINENVYGNISMKLTQLKENVAAKRHRYFQPCVIVLYRKSSILTQRNSQMQQKPLRQHYCMYLIFHETLILNKEIIAAGGLLSFNWILNRNAINDSFSISSKVVIYSSVDHQLQ